MQEKQAMTNHTQFVSGGMPCSRFMVLSTICTDYGDFLLDVSVVFTIPNILRNVLITYSVYHVRPCTEFHHPLPGMRAIVLPLVVSKPFRWYALPRSTRVSVSREKSTM